jgi:16S rRNA (cytosine967-C5)-methyltransferase
MSDSFVSEQGVSSRVAAAQLVEMVLAKRMTIDDALDRVATKNRLSDEDKRLVHAISGCVFRKLPYIDTVLRHLMTQGKDPKPPILRNLLRVGIAQLLYMAVPEHAAVNTAVSATGSLRLSKQKGLVNAILRSAQRQKQQLLNDEPDALEMLPEWLKDGWIAHYGELESKAMAAAMAQEAPVDIVIKDAQASLYWAQMLEGEVLISGAVRVRQRGGHIASWPGFHDGAWWVQDLSASLPIKMLGDVSDKSVLDVCAAPGGKTQMLARGGAKVTALDIAPSRMKRVTENLARLNMAQQVQTVVADALKYKPATLFDIVVLDAPCSSTGTLRRHPELSWIHERNQLSKLTVIQRDMLRHCADLVKSEGIMLYCTCSLEPEEGESQVEAFLSERNDFKEIKRESDALSSLLQPGVGNIGYRTKPHVLASSGGMDGFFIALLKKI